MTEKKNHKEDDKQEHHDIDGKPGRYKYIDDLTSDVLFEAYGKKLEELFKNCAEAMFSIICQMDRIEPLEKREVIIEAESKERLLMEWLGALIALVDTEEMFFSKFEVDGINDLGGTWELVANVYGEEIVPEKGETVVKAVTNYGFKLEKTEKGYLARVSLDI